MHFETINVTYETLARLHGDEIGLDDFNQRMLGSIGPGALAASVSEDRDTIEGVYELYLIQLRFLECTQRGRVAMREVYEHLGMDFGPEMKESLQRGFSSESGWD